MSSPGLRERKKQKTRWAIQEHAVRLFVQQGYDATTIEQIAEAAEISPSTFFRYFPTKEDVVIQDAYDPMIVSALEAAPAGVGPVTALRQAMRSVYSEIGEDERRRAFERTKLIMAVPALRARTLENFTEMSTMLAESFGRRGVGGPGDFRLRTLAGVCIGALMASVFAWAESDGERDLGELMDESLGLLEDGTLNAP